MSSSSQNPLPTQQTQATNTHSFIGIQTRDPSDRQTVDQRFRQQGHRDRQRDDHCELVKVMCNRHISEKRLILA